jgi:hypothetical protein
MSALFANEWDERKSPNLFCLDGVLKKIWEYRCLDILDANGLGVFDIPRPGRVTFKGAAITIRQAAPGGKAHDAGIIEQQDRGSPAAQRAGNDVQSGFVNVVLSLGAVQLFGEPIELLGNARRRAAPIRRLHTSDGARFSKRQSGVPVAPSLDGPHSFAGPQHGRSGSGAVSLSGSAALLFHPRQQTRASWPC